MSRRMARSRRGGTQRDSVGVVLWVDSHHLANAVLEMAVPQSVVEGEQVSYGFVSVG